MKLDRRADLAEVMDAPDFPLADYNACLADLERVNRLTLTHRPTLAFLSRMVPSGGTVSVLDVGYGHGDGLRAIASWAARRNIAARLEGIDLNPRSAVAAGARGGDITYRTGDVFGFKPDPRPDFIVSSQFTHHLDNAQLARFIAWMEATATRGWFISDLHRTAYAYYGFRVLCRLAGWNRVVRHDGTISIARAFRVHDWERLLAITGVTGRIRAHVPSRLCVERVL